MSTSSPKVIWTCPTLRVITRNTEPQEHVLTACKKTGVNGPTGGNCGTIIACNQKASS